MVSNKEMEKVEGEPGECKIMETKEVKSFVNVNLQNFFRISVRSSRLLRVPHRALQSALGGLLQSLLHCFLISKARASESLENKD